MSENGQTEHRFSNRKEVRQEVLEMAKTDEVKPKTLVQKLCEVMGAVGYTQKTGWNEAQKYHYVTEADIAEKIRPELAKRNVIILPTMVSTTRTRIERNYFDKFDKCMKTKESWAVDVLMRWTVVDGDNGEQFICEIPGCSESPGDKGVYVAITGSEKYLLMKLFLLPTGDDPEADTNEPAGTKEAQKEAAQNSAKAIGDAKIAAAKKKASQSAPVAQQSLSYEWDDITQNAVIAGPEELMTANRDLLKPLWSNVAKAVMVNADQLEALKYQFEQRGVPFVQKKAES